MTLAQYLMAGFVFLALIPAAWWGRNVTAGALAVQFLAVQGLYVAWGPLSSPALWLTDWAVLFVIWSKRPVVEPLSSFGHLWRERSWWDRGVIACFPAAWAVYVFFAADWWSLWAVSMAQMLLAAGEPLADVMTRRRQAATVQPPEDGPLLAVAGSGGSG